MVFSSWIRSRTAKAQNYRAAPSHTSYDTELDDIQARGRANASDARGESSCVRDVSSVAPTGRNPSLQPLGKPTVKKTLHTSNVLEACSALICLALAIAVIANESLSWRLGSGNYGNYQLIVLGFLLGIMNLHLRSVAPTLFFLLEARIGSSTLQNYEGIVRNKIRSPKLSFTWRLTLGVMLALPLTLSAAYKRYSGGQSVMRINAAKYTKNHASYYGMFAPPGLQLLGELTGVSLFSNATLPFAVAANFPIKSDAPLPRHAQAYGFNVLSLNNESTAMLDIPHPNYVSSVQTLLARGESWNITASVIATVASFNHSKERDERKYYTYFNSVCKAALGSSGAYTKMSMLNDWSVQLLSHPSPGDQSLQYIGLQPDPGIEHQPPCASNFSNYAQAFDISRRPCNGTWRITRGSIELIDGSCNDTILAPEKQLVITNNSNGLFLGVWYMSSLVEFLGPFATTRNGSHWTGPFMATGMAAMLWSRITALNSAANLAENYSEPNHTLEEAGIIYPVDDNVWYIRPTMLKLASLYCVLGIQPLLILIILGATIILHSTPLDKGFGLISILSGIDRQSLDILAGAALSGELTEDVKLLIQPMQEDNDNGAIAYHVERETTVPLRNGKLNPKIMYH